ncbi:MAG: SPOR domain-containing protein [Gemmatimonadaceae bacterium]|nr:SPOR domain-containing protein [Gemmatimonadaceae bacterium]
MHATRALLLTLAAAAVVGCGETRLTPTSVPTGVGPDAILVRVPRAGGTARAYRAGRDSVVWTASARVPASSSLLGFDDFQSALVGRDTAGRAWTLDLRLGTVEPLGQTALRDAVHAEGGAVFGLDPQGHVIRLTSVATWSWSPRMRAEDLVPTPDGALIVAGAAGGRTVVQRLIPPETVLTDSATLPAVQQVVRTPVGDRLWFVTDSGLIALRSRDLTRALLVRITGITALESTPSGDRVYLASDRPTLRVIDRFAERETGRIPLPAPALALRMDPDGRYLLVRTAQSDSIQVVSVGTARVITTIAGDWRDDLPLVTPDGRVLVAQGPDVAHIDAETGRERLRYAGGAQDLWLQIRWNGFRPRAAGLDRPVEFEEFSADSAAADSAIAAMMAARYGAITSLPPEAPPAAQGQDPAPPRPAGKETWTVSFATLLAEDRAREMADRIRVDGRVARVVAGNRDGIPIWRVVLGPFDSRDDAERAGIASKLPYWVFEGPP